MLTFILDVLVVYGLTLALRKLFRRFIVKTPIDNLPGPEAKSWLGVLPQIFHHDAWAFHDELILKYGGAVKIPAGFGENHLYISDPLALHHIVVKAQQPHIRTWVTFNAWRALIKVSKTYVTNDSLGEVHKRQRKLLNPAFSSAHMRVLTPDFYEITNKFRDALASHLQDGPRQINMLDWLSRTALEIVGQTAFGHSFASLTEDQSAHPFATALKTLEPAVLKVIIPRTYLLPLATKIGTPSLLRFLMDLIPYKAAHEVRDVSDLLWRTSLDIFNAKKAALADSDEVLSKKITRGKDIMSLLLKANMHAADEDKLLENELVAQISTFTFAATDTTSSALSRTLYLLANHQEIQDKLRQEVHTALEQKERLTYDELNELKYLDAICRETLRLFPPLPVLQRTTRENVLLPLGTPIQGLDGKFISEIPVPNNTHLMISIIGYNRDPKLWGDDSFEWKPERWLQRLPETIAKAPVPGIYSNLMTFLGGGRACIGFKFSQLEMKVILSVLINAFKFTLASQEVVWHMTSIVTPTVRNQPGARLPLVVEFAR